MQQSPFSAAWQLISTQDPVLWGILQLSLQVSLSATLIASLLGLPLAALLVLSQFRGKAVLITLINTLMGLPPVVVGLMVYLLLSRAGPLGDWGLLYTPSAMVMAQSILVLPIITALAREALVPLQQQFRPLFLQLGTPVMWQISTLLYEARYVLITTVLAGLGRALAEVGAVMIVGGNINHVTRVMTTSIALETSKGNLPLALGLGIILLSVTLSLNALIGSVQHYAKRYHRHD